MLHENSIRKFNSFHPLGGAYELHGYVHIDVIVEFMVYVKGMTETCGHLASIRTKAAKDKIPKLKRIIDLECAVQRDFLACGRPAEEHGR